MSTPAAAVEFVRRCHSCGSADHGRPAVAETHRLRPRAISVAHTLHHVGLAISSEPIGLDIEQDPATPTWDEVTALIRHPDDDARDNLSGWTAKEAVLKLLSVGLHWPMTAVCVRGATWTTTPPPAARAPTPTSGVVEWFSPAGGVLAAVATPRPTEVRVSRWW